MTDDKARKTLPRWKKGGQRNVRGDEKVLAKLWPRAGWRNGARVSQK